MRSDHRIDTWEYFRRLSEIQAGRMTWLSVDPTHGDDILTVTVQFEPGVMHLVDQPSKSTYNRDFFKLSDEHTNSVFTREAVDCVFIKRSLRGGSTISVRTLYGS